MTDPQPQHPEVRDLLQITDPAVRAMSANKLIGEHQSVVNEAAQVRRGAIEEMMSTGLSQTDIGKQLGMTRARVGQLLNAGPRPERAFLGSGTIITIAVGGKPEAGRTDGKQSTLLSGEATAAYERLAELARSLGLKTEPIEVVAPPGHVNLNRPGLIVLCGPRLLPFVGQVLEADPRFGFAEDDNGNYLIDRANGKEYRSPSDAGGHSDYAYIGRLPRPDGKGNFLFLAGIHAAGTNGAASYVEANIGDLWEQCKTRRFSVLVESQYNPKTKAITAVTPLTDLHRHEGVG
ncbi:sigma-70 family RNA polymerase sigma factor [Micromonospora sp. NPDC048935]|uniref:sigma-70 family RNA polymerase sigma factor n=1 Tax=Micromonospora sp. NPDC048935 TaxID=3364262 RepID=UPI003719535B